MTKIRVPRLAYNWISALGMALALISALTLVLLLAASMFIETGSNPYFGIFLYMVLPGIMIAGLLIVPLGMWKTARSWKREGAPQAARFPVLDLNNVQTPPCGADLLHQHPGLPRPLRHGQLRRLPSQRIGRVLRRHLPRGDGARVHDLPEQPARPRRLRAVPRRRGRRLVRQVEALRCLPDLLRRGEQVPAPDSDPGAQPAPGAGNLRAVPLAGAHLRRRDPPVQSLHVRRGEHPLAGQHADQGRRRRSGDRPDGRHPLAHEHRRPGGVHRARRRAPGDPVDSRDRPEDRPRHRLQGLRGSDHRRRGRARRRPA